MPGKNGSGCHIQLPLVSSELVSKLHASGKIVAVWVETDPEYKSYEEDEEFYRKLYDMEVDLLTTNQPSVAHRYLQAYHEEV